MKYNVHSIRQSDQEMVDLIEALIGRHYFVQDIRCTVTAVFITKSGVIRVKNNHGGYHKLSEIQNELVEIEVTK